MEQGFNKEQGKLPSKCGLCGVVLDHKSLSECANSVDCCQNKDTFRCKACRDPLEGSKYLNRTTGAL